MSAPGLTARVELRLGLAFWVVVGTVASLTGAFWHWLVFALPVAALVVLWPMVRRRTWSLPLLDWLPLPFVMFTYEMLHVVVPDFWRTTIDAWLVAADRAVLGADAAVLLEPLVSRPLTVVMACAYAAYYPLTVSLALWFWFRRQRTAFREYVVGEIGVLFIGYLGYLFLPATGPHAWLPASTWSVPLEGDFIAGMNRALYAAHGDCHPRDAFPSLHTANAVTILLVAWKFDRRAFVVALLPCLGLIASTVYLRLHYVVDVVAGAALAVVWQGFVPRLEGHARGPEPAASAGRRRRRAAPPVRSDMR